MTAARKVIPRLRAKYLKPDMARTARLGREAAGISQRELADQLGVQSAHVARMELDYEPHAPTIAHVARGPVSWAEPLLRWAAAAHRLQVVAAAEVRHGDDHVKRASIATIECTDVPRELTRAIADGVWTDDELESVSREARQAADAALELEAWCTAELTRRRQDR